MLLKMLIVILLLSIFVPFGVFFTGKKKKGNFKISLACNTILFFGTLLITDILMFGGKIYAADEVAATVSSSVEGWKFIAAALSTGLSCIGGGIAVASSASAALGALSEDSSLMSKALIFVALAEGIALYGLIVSLIILFN